MTAVRANRARALPRPLVRIAWVLHRALYRASGGRVGLSQPEAGVRFGMMRLATVGRRSGRARVAIVGYFEDGPNIVTLAMNGWGAGEPAWWLNLQANPEATVGLASGPRSVRARAASGAERDRLWARLHAFPGWGADVDALAAGRPTATAVVVLEPRTTELAASAKERAGSGHGPELARSPSLPIYRVNLMRAGYLLLAVGLAATRWPLLGGASSLPVFEGVVTALLTAMSLLAFLGLRYPIQLLPLLLFESLWKVIWLGAVALPHLVAGDMSAELGRILLSVSVVVVILAVTPWDYVWNRYVGAPGDAWRRPPADRSARQAPQP